jgi:hypothetical protein
MMCGERSVDNVARRRGASVLPPFCLKFGSFLHILVFSCHWYVLGQLNAPILEQLIIVVCFVHMGVILSAVLMVQALVWCLWHGLSALLSACLELDPKQISFQFHHQYVALCP